MQKSYENRRSSAGTKAIAIDQRDTLRRYRFYMLLSLLLSTAFALGLHIVFQR